ncbi:TetR family transcriptional regulator [Candidatus Enterococcus courvalinii]|uniref:TetR family transcriptional regulator n=1 Tax=Candidatus Enterococcus courvalinii TaxID=2815329 RepID=A0ABS3I0T4_9ENTE|nr:TetR family transcriptional regulator [Enterococcus sp. MSG2901]MBO0482328.1 TetR family transcriptional regulator [Enterococcus sp. MSG2901]
MDRRVRKTQTATQTAFFQLLKKQDIERVKVSEICELADINRGTFYLNYLDKYDLLEKMIQQSIQELITYCQTETTETDDLLIKTFQFIVENQETYRMLIASDKQGLFTDYLKKHILTFTATNNGSNFYCEWNRRCPESLFVFS